MTKPKLVSVVVALVDAALVTLKSLTTFLLLIAFGVGARVVNGLARFVSTGGTCLAFRVCLLLKATLASSGSSPPSKNTKKLAVPRDGSSTLNYLYGNSAPSPTPIARPPPSPGVQGAKNARKQHGSQNKDPHGHLPARMSLTESIKVWIWLTVDIAFDIPRYLLGTASHPLPAHKNTHLQSIVQMENPVTTSSVIRAAGYPLEEHTVTTSDGYVLTMQRLPRKDAKKVVFFMHGVLDTSLGWVCNGPMGSHAFTAHDSGADVWLGNCRANEGVGDKRRGRAPSDYLRYWAFSVNELGLNDVEGMLRYISMTVSGSDRPGKELHIVAHSLGAAAVLIHLVFPREGSDRSGHGRFRRETVGSGGPNDRATDRSIGATRSPSSNLCIKQVILLAPAGFHSQAPFLALPFLYTVPPLVRLANGLMGAFHAQFGLPAYIPSKLLRSVAFKLATDFHSVPALNELSLSLLRLLVNGDCSDWDRALQMPHYAAESMPAISVHTGAHLIQFIRRQKFELYDYGWKKLNRRHYGADAPPDVSAGYGNLADLGVRVHLVAGAYDGVISKENIRRHYDCMQRCGVDVAYTEMELGHLDVCVGGHEDVVQLVDRLLGGR